MFDRRAPLSDVRLASLSCCLLDSKVYYLYAYIRLLSFAIHVVFCYRLSVLLMSFVVSAGLLSSMFVEEIVEAPGGAAV